jgi:hypothetical protein
MRAAAQDGMAIRRLVQVAAGAVAGLLLWALGPDGGGLAPGLWLALFVFLCAEAAVGLVLTGPVAPGRAFAGALVLALPVTGLAVLASRRYAVATDLLDQPVTLAALAVLVFFAAPFLLVGLRNRAEVLDYARLFSAAWAITLRILAGCGLVAAFWAVVYLAAALLELVDIRLVEALMAAGWARFGLSGAVLGMGLAAAYDLRHTVKPEILLRLLRLLVPVQLAVVAAFLLAVPLRGLGGLFGQFSAAGILIGTGIAAVTLVSTGVDRDDRRAVTAPLLRLSTRALALMLPFLAALSVWAVVERVGQHGWTPDRVLAGGAALFLLAYGLGYGIAALGGDGWMGRIRSVNVIMALAVIAGAALWLTPVLDSGRISARSKVGLYAGGGAGPEELPLWRMQHGWGLAGQAGLVRLDQLAAERGDTDMAELVALVREAETGFAYASALRRRHLPQDLAELARLMVLRPDTGTGIDPDLLNGLPEIDRAAWLDGCRRPLPDGRPGCVMVAGAFAPALRAGVQVIVLYLDATGFVRGSHAMVEPDGTVSVRVIYDPLADTWPRLPVSALVAALDGAFRIVPRPGLALDLGATLLEPSY